MREIHPDFGKGCYVDSTPLPKDIDDNPFNALCCHGVSSSEVQSRLVLVLDDETGLPVCGTTLSREIFWISVQSWRPSMMLPSVLVLRLSLLYWMPGMSAVS